MIDVTLNTTTACVEGIGVKARADPRPVLAKVEVDGFGSQDVEHLGCDGEVAVLLPDLCTESFDYPTSRYGFAVDGRERIEGDDLIVTARSDRRKQVRVVDALANSLTNVPVDYLATLIDGPVEPCDVVPYSIFGSEPVESLTKSDGFANDARRVTEHRIAGLSFLGFDDWNGRIESERFRH